MRPMSGPDSSLQMPLVGRCSWRPTVQCIRKYSWLAMFLSSDGESRGGLEVKGHLWGNFGVCVCVVFYPLVMVSSRTEATVGSTPNPSFQRDQKLEASGVSTAAKRMLGIPADPTSSELTWLLYVIITHAQGPRGDPTWQPACLPLLSCCSVGSGFGEGRWFTKLL